MGLISKTLTGACALTGLACASQLPEFTQQYRQHLAGAVEELRTIVTDFDADATKSGLSRGDALQQMVNSADAFPRDRGISMTKTINRFEKLDDQKRRMEKAEPVSRPLFLFSTYDEKLLNGSWEIFEPAIPLNLPGAMWGGFGAFLFGFLTRIPIGVSRLLGKKFRRNENMNSDQQIGVVSDQLLEIASPNVLNGVEPNLLVEKPNNQTSLLDQIALDERVVGEIDAKGQFLSEARTKRASS